MTDHPSDDETRDSDYSEQESDEHPEQQHNYHGLHMRYASVVRRESGSEVHCEGFHASHFVATFALLPADDLAEHLTDSLFPLPGFASRGSCSALPALIFLGAGASVVPAKA